MYPHVRQLQSSERPVRDVIGVARRRARATAERLNEPARVAAPANGKQMPVRSTWLITGASRGFGRELTEQLLARGDRVAATLRRPERLEGLAARYRDRLWIRALDVTDTAQIRQVVDAAFAELGRIDVVVSNAGHGLFGAAEEVSDAQIERQVRTNLTGAIQLARAVVPHLRAQGGGRILQLSSMGGQIAFPGLSIYHATQWGIEGFYESLAAEVAPFGIDTILVEPGFARTGFAFAIGRDGRAGAGVRRQPGPGGAGPSAGGEARRPGQDGQDDDHRRRRRRAAPAPAAGLGRPRDGARRPVRAPGVGQLPEAPGPRDRRRPLRRRPGDRDVRRTGRRLRVSGFGPAVRPRPR